MSVSFESTLAGIGRNTGIEVPESVLAELGGGKRPAVEVLVNGFAYRNTVGVMGGRSLISVSAQIRKETGLSAGDPISVTLTLAEGPREVVVPEDLVAAFAAEPAAETFFNGLSNSLQRFHVDNINGAKTPETRERRIAKAVSLFLAGKAR